MFSEILRCARASPALTQDDNVKFNQILAQAKPRSNAPLPSLRDTFPRGGRQECRVRNGFYVQDKIPRLTLGMTRTVLFFRDPSTRTATPWLAQDDIREGAALGRDDNVKFNQILAQAKPRFCARTPNLRDSAPAGKVKPRHFDKGVPPKYAAARKTPIAPRCKRGQWGFPQITKFCFISLKQNL